MDISNVLLAFVEGVGLILSPCILPVLPIILSVGLEGGRARPYGVIFGFIATFCCFTLLSRQLILSFMIDSNVIRLISYYLLLLFGVVLFSSTLSKLFNQFTAGISNLGEKISQSFTTQNGFLSGVLLGGAIGLIWTPCAGPLLAAVVVQTIQGTTTTHGVVILGAFAVGAALPMLILTLVGRGIIGHLNFLKRKTDLIRKAIGLIIIVTILVTGGREMFHIGSDQGVKDRAQETTLVNQEDKFGKQGLVHPLLKAYPAPSLLGGEAWLNSSPLSIENLKGKVVLIDFWTYSLSIVFVPYPIL